MQNGIFYNSNVNKELTFSTNINYIDWIIFFELEKLDNFR